MITEEYIRECTNTTFFQRGKSIQSSGWKIEEFSVSDEEEDREYIDALVAGSRNNHYRVTGVYDYEDQEVYDM